MAIGFAPLAAPTARVAVRRTDGVGDSLVRRGAAGRHRSERVPDPQLKRRSHGIDGQRLEREQVAGEIRAKRTRRPSRIRTLLDDPGNPHPPQRLELVLEVGAVIAKLNPHQASAAGEDGERTER